MKWKTKDGRELELYEMDDSHLLNAHRYCRKQVRIFTDMLRCAEHPVFAPRGDGARELFQRELEATYDRAAVFYVVEEHLEREILRRGLTPLDLPPPLDLPEVEEVHDVGIGTIFKLKKGGHRD